MVGAAHVVIKSCVDFMVVVRVGDPMGVAVEDFPGYTTPVRDARNN